MSQEKSTLIEISGLWVNESKAGKKYMSGRMGNATILIFKNDKKEDKQPDYRMYLAPPRKKEEQATAPESGETDENGDPLPF